MSVFIIYSLSIKKLSQISVDSKYVEKDFDRILGIRIPYLLLKVLACHGFLKNINKIVILKFLKRMLE